MKEELLHYAWRMGRFDLRDLRTTDGQAVQIFSVGRHNATHQGPDFVDARIRIGQTLWAGNVEIHVRASEWLQHGHQHDPHYRNVILHVVLEADTVVADHQGHPLPTLELKDRIDVGLLDRYYRLMHGSGWVPCATRLDEVRPLVRSAWLERLAVERLEQRAAHIEALLADTRSDWEEAFYRWLLRAWGTKRNAAAFERLARHAPLRLLAHYRHSPLQVEALLFGQAGLLDRSFDADYPLRLQREYHFLQRKHQLTPMPPGSWHFMRMRPSNFPTVRLAQLASLIVRQYPLFRRFAEGRNIAAIAEMLDLEVSSWWQTHYTFDKAAQRPPGKPGRHFVHLLVINGLSPFLFVYAKYRDDEMLRQRALDWLLELPAEHNRIIRNWQAVGWAAHSAFESQALIQLHNIYCSRLRCLQCTVGHALLRP